MSIVSEIQRKYLCSGLKELANNYKLKYMNKKLCFVLTTIFLSMIQSSSADDKVVVTDVNGEKVSFLLSANPEVSFDAYSLIIKTDNETVLYPISEYRSFTIEKDPSDIKQTTTPLQIPTFSVKNEILEASGIEPASNVCVYNVSGMLISKGNADKDGNISLPLNAKQGSVCVITTSQGSFKVCVR